MAGTPCAVYAFACGLMEGRVSGKTVQLLAFCVLLALILFTAGSGMQ